MTHSDLFRPRRAVGAMFPGGALRVLNRAVGILVLAALGLAGMSAGHAQTAAPPKPANAPASGETAGRPGRFVPSVYREFTEWKAACDRLPSNRSLKLTVAPKNVLPLKNFRDFVEVLEAYFQLCRTSALAQSSAWLGPTPTFPQFFNTDAVYFLRPALPFQPFVQRAFVPPGTQLILHGDMHGDILSLVAWIDWMNRHGYMQGFRIARPDVRLLFLGDYTDRGLYGIEVLYTILRLKLENPDQVLIVRGNHEDVSLASRYGFLLEGREKYGRSFDAKRVLRLYDFLPLALYLGCGTNFAQCNHGGMEPGFDPRGLLDAPDGVQFQLLGRLNQQQFVKDHPDLARGFTPQARRLMESALLDFQPESPTVPSVIGFMWNDFSVVHGEAPFDYDPGRAFIYGEGPTQYLLNQYSTKTRRLQAVFRAHQQATILNSMMRRLLAGHGVYRHWQETDSLPYLMADIPVVAQKIELGEERRIPPGSVWTFNVVPDSVYGDALNFSFDTFGILTVANDFGDWKLRVVNQNIRK